MFDYKNVCVYYIFYYVFPIPQKKKNICSKSHKEQITSTSTDPLEISIK